MIIYITIREGALMIDVRNATFEIFKFVFNEGAMVGLVHNEEVDTETVPPSFELFEFQKIPACPDALGNIVRHNADRSLFKGSILLGRKIALGPGFVLALPAENMVDTGVTCTMDDLRVYSVYCSKCSEQGNRPMDFVNFAKVRAEGLRKAKEEENN